MAILAALTGATGLSTNTSARLAEDLAKLVPGGVNSPFRSFHEVGGHTIFLDSARGAYVFDVDGNRYIDYLGAWGPAILGHCVPAVMAACQKAIAKGPVFGAPHLLELELARLVTSLYPSIDKIRFVNSGTEAVMSAVRLARAYTKRDLIVMFEGCYHGHSDSVLASRSHKASGGIPDSFSHQTILMPFNDLAALRQCLLETQDQVAAVLIEPVAGSMGVIQPQEGFLEGIRELCCQANCLLIFDEVLTGLRVATGGAQQIWDVQPDLTCFGKALGGGLPIGAYGGAEHIMNCLQPIGDAYQAGTFSGNPVTMAGGIETIKLLLDPQVYAMLESRTQQLEEGVLAAAKKQGISVQFQRVGSMFSILFSDKPVRNYHDSLSIDNGLFARFFRYLLAHGVYLPPSAVDAACLSYCHTQHDIEQTVGICAGAFQAVS